MYFLLSCENEEVLVERSIDGIAEYLGYTNGEEIEDLYKDDVMATAKAGKIFEAKCGQVCIYEFDPESDTYKELEEELISIDGFIIEFECDIFDEMSNDEIDAYMDKIENIRFIQE